MGNQRVGNRYRSWEGKGVKGGGKDKPLQVAPSLPKRAGNSCHSLSNVRLPGAGPSTQSIPVSWWHVNDKTLITPLINRNFFFSSMRLVPAVW